MTMRNWNNIHDSFLTILEQRQESIVSRLPTYAKATIVIAAVGFLVTLVGQLLTQMLGGNGEPINFPFQLTIGGVVVLLLSILVNMVMWVFVIWSVSFIPFVAYWAQQSSVEFKATAVSKPFRWVQLYIATFLPMTLFAVAWLSAPIDNTASGILVHIDTLFDAIVVVIGTVLTLCLLFAINGLIPLRYAALRLCLVSLLLYTVLFLAYGWGYGPSSHSMVFGILTYLAIFGSSQVEEMWRRIAIYDVDPRIADRVEGMATNLQETQVTLDETQLKEQEYEAQAQRQKLELKKLQAESDKYLNEQLAEINQKKAQLNRRMNEAQLFALEQKLQLLDNGFQILFKELYERANTDVQSKLTQLKEQAKDLSGAELAVQIKGFIAQINAMEGIPESMRELRAELLLTALEIEQQTQQLFLPTEASGVTDVQNEHSSVGQSAGNFQDKDVEAQKAARLEELKLKAAEAAKRRREV